MGKVYMSKAGLFAKISYNKGGWNPNYTFETAYVSDINKATVFGEERFPDMHTDSYKINLERIKKVCIELEANLQVERVVTLEIKDKGVL